MDVNRVDRRHQAFPERRELVVDPCRDAGCDGAGDQAVAFQGAECLGEHFLAHARDDPAQAAVVQRAVGERYLLHDGCCPRVRPLLV